MGPRLNWIRKAKWMNSGFPGSEELLREKNSVDKVSVLQQQILTLTEEVKSQKVSVMKRLLFLRVRALRLGTGTPLHIGVIEALRSAHQTVTGDQLKLLVLPPCVCLSVPSTKEDLQFFLGSAAGVRVR